MFAKNETEFVILKLIFVPSHIDVSDPIICNYRSTQIHPIRGDPLSDWIFYMMYREQAEVPNGNSVQYRVWKIKSNDILMFTIDNIRFDNVLLFVGETKIHWLYHNTEPIFRSAEGMTPLTLTYCSCCFYDQYPKFIENIQENLKETGYFLS